MEAPQNGWFTMEHATKWMIWGTTILGNHQMMFFPVHSQIFRKVSPWYPHQWVVLSEDGMVYPKFTSSSWRKWQNSPMECGWNGIPWVSETISGWWCNNYLRKYDFVNGKDDIPYIMENHKNHVPNHQPVLEHSNEWRVNGIWLAIHGNFGQTSTNKNMCLRLGWSTP